MKKSDVNEILQADLDHVWHPQTQHKVLRTQPPLVMISAEGSTVVDSDGREYLDGMAGLWCVNAGYGRREVAEAVYRQMLAIAYFPHTQANEPAAVLADRLAELTGGGLSHTYFVNSGSEANEAAFKLARQYQKQVRTGESRHKLVSRYYAYHGTTLSTLAAGGLPERKVPFEPLDGNFIHVPPAYCYRCPFSLTPSSCDLQCAKQIDYAIKAEGAQTVAAVVLEPIQSGLGVLVPPDDYLPEVARICRNHGVLLILDEVINGFGRTGKWFAHQHYDVIPDILSLAKGLSSGYQPIGAVMTTEAVFSGFLGEPAENKHAVQVNTWGGHAAACAGALANLRIMTEEELPNRAAEVGAYLLDGLRTLLSIPIVGDVRGKGLLLGVELVESPESKEPMGGARMAAVLRECQNRGLIVGRSGGAAAGLGNSIVLSPPLILTRAEADRIVSILSEVLPQV